MNFLCQTTGSQISKPTLQHDVGRALLTLEVTFRLDFPFTQGSLDIYLSIIQRVPGGVDENRFGDLLQTDFFPLGFPDSKESPTAGRWRVEEFESAPRRIYRADAKANGLFQWKEEAQQVSSQKCFYSSVHL